MTERELLEAVMGKLAATEAKVNTIEAKLDTFVAEYKSLLYGFARDVESESESGLE